jgi:hypothetical protein
MSDQQQRSQTATATTAPQSEPDTSEPTPERQAELRAAYEANVAAGKPPYENVWIRTLGAVHWILRERDWSVDSFLPNGMQRPNLRGADLFDANLSGATLSDMDLRDANLSGANLSGATLLGADSRGANLSEARMDVATMLDEVHLDARTRLGDVCWNGVPLTRVRAWPARLGDEQRIRDRQRIRVVQNRKALIDAYRDAARAYRGLSFALRSQDLLIPASNYRLREQVLEGKARFLELSFLGWTFSWLLFLVAGYGERPVRSFVAYLLVLFGFAGAYFAATNGLLGFGIGAMQMQPLQWYEALVLSVSSFHGRGFFQPVQSLGDPVAILAAIEAVMGLFIEITFIATFTQRFFGGR